MKSVPGIYLLVAPVKDFQRFNHISIPTDFAADEVEKFPGVTFLTSHIKSAIEAVGVVKNNNEMLQSKIDDWAKTAKGIFTESVLQTKVIQDAKYNQTLVEYFKQIQPDMIMLFKKDKTIFDRLFKKDLLKDLLCEVQVPTLFFNR